VGEEIKINYQRTKNFQDIIDVDKFVWCGDEQNKKSFDKKVQNNEKWQNFEKNDRTKSL
jgi:hypothetical protein